MKIRRATLEDFDQLYPFANQIPELKVSASGNFMEPDEFKWAMTNPKGIFLVAEEDQAITGFAYANVKDSDRPYHQGRWACLVYLAVRPEHRRKGIAQALYDQCEATLKEMGISRLYAWASLSGDQAVVKFNKKQGFVEGHQYVWMDKEL